jgi:enoyl-CoA hydratase/carnithine racemase
VGTLARLPRIVGNGSAVAELAFTARRFDAEEALRLGLVSLVVPSRAELRSRGLALAHRIAAKSPVAQRGTKRNLVPRATTHTL